MHALRSLNITINYNPKNLSALDRGARSLAREPGEAAGPPFPWPQPRARSLILLLHVSAAASVPQLATPPHVVLPLLLASSPLIGQPAQSIANTDLQEERADEAKPIPRPSPPPWLHINAVGPPPFRSARSSAWQSWVWRADAALWQDGRREQVADRTEVPIRWQRHL
jgi:hypothetical protein